MSITEAERIVEQYLLQGKNKKLGREEIQSQSNILSSLKHLRTLLTST